MARARRAGGGGAPLGRKRRRASGVEDVAPGDPTAEVGRDVRRRGGAIRDASAVSPRARSAMIRPKASGWGVDARGGGSSAGRHRPRREALGTWRKGSGQEGVQLVPTDRQQGVGGNSRPGGRRWRRAALIWASLSARVVCPVAGERQGRSLYRYAMKQAAGRPPRPEGVGTPPGRDAQVDHPLVRERRRGRPGSPGWRLRRGRSRGGRDRERRLEGEGAVRSSAGVVRSAGPRAGRAKRHQALAVLMVDTASRPWRETARSGEQPLRKTRSSLGESITTRRADVYFSIDRAS